MIRSKVASCSFAFPLLMVFIGSALPTPQIVQPLTDEEVKSEAVKLYADAHPYLDAPLPELKKLCHELTGLKSEPSPEPLPSLLTKIGMKADQLLQKVPDLISDEMVTQTAYPASQGLTPGDVGGGYPVPENSTTFVRDFAFNYLILTHTTQGGQLLQEYRTDENGKSVGPGKGAPNFQGFISAWLAFSSANQVESHFRYLGRQQISGHRTFVIGFAQIPGSVASPGVIVSPTGSVPMLLQGIAWVDQSDFRIVRLRTDLLAPQPEISLRTQTATIAFGAVHIANLDGELWLPQAVHAEIEAGGKIFQEQHKYSKYRLYHAKSKIILSPNN